MFRIIKEFSFEASHQLTAMPKDHPCNRNHGHSYRVRVALVGEQVDDLGMVTDYHNLKIVKDWIDTHLDHQNLNDVFTFPTTAENLAMAIHDTVCELLTGVNGYGDRWGVDTVSVSETVKTWAEYCDV